MTEVDGALRRVAARLAIAATLALATRGLATTYEVGPGQVFPTVSDVPWETLIGGDTVLIHWRRQPYREKWVIAAAGTPQAPVTIRGVPGPDGTLPIIDGENATTRLALDYWNESRSVIKVGGSSHPPNVLPTCVVIEGLDVRGGRPPYSFTDDAGNPGSYASNAAAIHVERGTDVTIRNCILRDSGNGLFVSSSDQEAARDLLIEGNWLHSNGNPGSAFHHNAYTAAIGITYQFNRFGPLAAGADGNNLKDRSAGLVVRCNWIEGGNRQLDLVDAEDSGLIRGDLAYATTHVLGNILIEPDGAGNSQVVHYGGDSGVLGAYRKGTLHFRHNTVVSTRSGNTTLFRLSTDDEHCDARNNVFYVTADGNRLAILNADGAIDLSHNWRKPGWVNAHGGFSGVVNDDGTSIVGSAPGFVDEVGQDYRLAPGSSCVDAAGAALPNAPAPDEQYDTHRRRAIRPVLGTTRDVGAYEQRATADLDGDGAVGFGDVLVIIAAWGPCPVPPESCEADLGGNGSVDFADILAAIATWGL
ncbi:MAG: polysaccharide-degrading enzyme [Planctomycetes bacterium]|nr:polysaccharide-degrading enzyme [Planctomycetota bacterium]